MSSTVEKALDLLTHFSQSRAEIGLSELARLAGRDKATTHRMMQALARHGIVEQDATSKAYRLGAGILRLARMREASFPVSSLIMDALRQLNAETGETSHASLIAGNSLATVGLVKGTGAIHVTLDDGESLPFHATASGIACMAFLPADQVRAILKRKLARFTPHTLTAADDVLRLVEEARACGYAMSNQSYEADVFGIAAPIFSASGTACGAVSVSTPALRMTRDVKTKTIHRVMAASVNLTRSMGGEPPPAFSKLLLKVAS